MATPPDTAAHSSTEGQLASPLADLDVPAAVSSPEEEIEAAGPSASTAGDEGGEPTSVWGKLFRRKGPMEAGSPPAYQPATPGKRQSKAAMQVDQLRLADCDAFCVHLCM